MLYELGNGQWNIPALALLRGSHPPQHNRRVRGRARFSDNRRRAMFAERSKGLFEGNNSTSYCWRLSVRSDALEREKDELIHQRFCSKE
jgi:hypothetical protein